MATTTHLAIEVGDGRIVEVVSKGAPAYLAGSAKKGGWRMAKQFDCHLLGTGRRFGVAFVGAADRRPDAAAAAEAAATEEAIRAKVLAALDA